MPRKKKRPELGKCKVSQTTHPKAPWRVSYPVERDGRSLRVRKSFAREDDAWHFAELKEREITNHGLRFGELPPEARRAFDFYRDTVADLEGEGVSVPRFEELVADALKQLRDQHQQEQEEAVTIAEGVAAFLEYKRSRVGARQLSDLRTRLKRFAQTFGDRPVRSITTLEIESWLELLRSRKNPDKLPTPPLLSPLSRNHHRATLHVFFAFASGRARGWVDHNPLADLEPERVESREPEAYSPEDAAKIMQTALDQMPELVPALALGFFSGLRASEAQEIDLGKLPREGAEFRVTGKTGPRMAPLTEAARAWLAAQDRRAGKGWIRSKRRWDYAIDDLFKLARVQKIVNGARHTFITHRTAAIRDVAQVSDECGNSAATIRKFYRKIVTSEEAGRFFGIRPRTEAENITTIEEGRARA